MKKTLLLLSVCCLSLMVWSSPKKALGISEWGPIGGSMAIEGERALIEVRAVDETRHEVLATQYLWLDSAPESGDAVQVFDPGVLEHEDHAQVRLQLQDGESFSIDLFSPAVISKPGEKQRSTLAAAVTITIREGQVMVLSQPVDDLAATVRIHRDTNP